MEVSQFVWFALTAGIMALVTKWLQIEDLVADEVISRSRLFSLVKRTSLARVQSTENILLATIQMGAIPVQLNQFGEQCLQVSAENNDYHTGIKHVISASHWYGGPQYFYAEWPINSVDIPYQSYRTNDLLLTPSRVGSILDRYWLSSPGMAIYVAGDSEDFSMGLSNGDLIIGANRSLHYYVCYNGSLTDTHRTIIRDFFKKPSSIPDLDIFKKPIWSTWAKYKIFINETVIVDFANEIVKNGYSHSQIEIDDTYTTNYGDHIFDSHRFPNPKGMLSNLKDLGFRVTSWVHPFVNLNSRAFQVR